VRAVETGEPPPVTAADGRAALAIICAAYEAAAAGKAVPVT
jgi:predicted dehydrogenase